ncbi:RNA-directed DNA polymerase [Pseudomonas chlororaphis]|uniref:antiviral reverse transcriptase Drt3b n=1 Tax=Pseudomonas chlororaphis TaxID=587753 RepID=UPI00209AF239|nr:antiviral reverse transcriptase Drt3b [Pseudomonas chlororaphis]MCO7572772.1 RNA-directed DNA polymerase [Pseudomonas chlororaphis]MCO7591156.1 RNA-directed DNA polymerase [Pseudomonas chlororaphis]
MNNKVMRVRKTDYDRVVLTETCPYEVPIIFENLGIYTLLKISSGHISVEHPTTKLLIDKILKKDQTAYTIPMPYKIRKDSESFRELSLLHPASQNEIVSFYKEFQYKIINLCSLSDFSIRAPKKIASKYYKKNNMQWLNEYKSDKMIDTANEMTYKHLTSYFSYHGYRRLYNFFDSYEFMRLERKFSNFWSLDISKCFDSIYTESINWSNQEKDFSKNNSDVKNTFGSVFNRLMKTSNHNDSSGILIGPEISRIFAEIIFQKIDSDIKKTLEADNLEAGEDYEIRRYVDDIYVFSRSDNYATKVYEAIDKNIKKYKLSLNKSKTAKVKRPFVTKKTQVMLEIKFKLKQLEEKLLEKEDGSTKLFPKRIMKKNHIIISFANDIKSLCLDDASSYTMACNFLIKALTNISIKFCKKNSKIAFEKKSLTLFSDFFIVIIDLLFHFFTVNPSHSGAVQLCKMTTIIGEFCNQITPTEAPLIKSQIFSRCLDFFKSSEFSKISRQYSDDTLLETLNMLIVSSCLGDGYMLSTKDLNSIFETNSARTLSYFEIIVLLYYIKDNPTYSSIRSRVISSINTALDDLSDIKSSTNKAYLFFEVTTCPYLEEKVRTPLVKKALESTGLASHLTVGYDTQQVTQDLESIKFCSSWDRAAMMSLLEKKELQRVY